MLLRFADNYSSFPVRQTQVPAECTELHHEVELGVVIGKKCQRISRDKADEFIAGAPISLGLTILTLHQGTHWRWT